mmetsp:Transcript_44871/g.82565  ORF Transcript_44871/g.82565 Transcript_44871/m.82565 type:complete len:88 (-) Transcript_44871:331-594(-)
MERKVCLPPDEASADVAAEEATKGKFHESPAQGVRCHIPGPLCGLRGGSATEETKETSNGRACSVQLTPSWQQWEGGPESEKSISVW